ncbi:DUF3313 family protein [Mangrovimicrobium sediminis]|nr:DUF3313 family protein [Haliea sp. SAOS-164]
MHKLAIALRSSALAAVVLLAACAETGPKTEAYGVSFDGLEQVTGTGFADVYKKPGVQLGEYDTFALAPCEVAFRKNWLRDQNSSRLDLTSRVTQKDVDRIKGQLSEMCTGTFREELEKAPPYKLVDEFPEGEQVLVLAPAIINLDINAPDVMSAGRSRSYTTQSGEMTLYLELKDGATGDTLARIVDRRKDFDDMRLQWTNSVSNRADAQLILNRWAKYLRDGLDEVQAGK